MIGFFLPVPLFCFPRTGSDLWILCGAGLVLLNALRVIWKRLTRGISIFTSDETYHHYFLDLDIHQETL